MKAPAHTPHCAPGAFQAFAVSDMERMAKAISKSGLFGINSADQAMALDLLAAMEGRAAFPVTPRDSLEAGLTVMAIDEAQASAETIDCRPMWEKFDAARHLTRPAL